MGRGDKKTKKGKIWKGSYGNSRKRAVNKRVATPAAKVEGEVKPKPKAKKAVKKKAKAGDKE